MAPPLSNLGLALAALERMSSMELQTLHGITSSRFEKLVPVSHKCNFMSLSAELRNQIYTIYASDLIRNRVKEERTSNALAVVNKQISAEYLSILNSEEMLYAKCLVCSDPVRWVTLDARKLLAPKGNLFKLRKDYGNDAASITRGSFIIYINSNFHAGTEDQIKRSTYTWNTSSFYRGLLVYGERQESSLAFVIDKWDIDQYTANGTPSLWDKGVKVKAGPRW